ncbi:hypothetical protein HF086_002250 [Spodoptera exigua]|uniref:HTH psq-type domain-containing protein n=1 Tax=Spodoptera exigua TaxID=7107 RepID=A0A922MJP4_SPOEX|nr:hypothetical protein HF086_002250 [Spodoptera exigua]
MADKKRKHETLSLVKKMEILRKLDSGENQMKLAGEYGVGRATIYDIKKNREKIENFANTADAGTSSRQTVKIKRCIRGFFKNELVIRLLLEILFVKKL